MGRVLVHEFMSLDGYIDTPSWTADYPFAPAMGDAIGAVVSTCSGILLGRRTYEMFAPAWSVRTAEDDPGAPFFNGSPKHVVSSTLRNPEWANTTVVGPYRADTIRDLKSNAEGNLYVSGSATLVRAMLADGLVDELHLFVFPLALGGTLRLFAEGARVPLTLDTCESYDSGVVHLGYSTA
jgi:dihydrofolate reductase